MLQFYHQELSDKLLGMAFTVHNILGPGLLEAVRHGRLRAVHSHGWPMILKAFTLSICFTKQQKVKDYS
jgi:hypothetical protein